MTIPLQSPNLQSNLQLNPWIQAQVEEFQEAFGLFDKATESRSPDTSCCWTNTAAESDDSDVDLPWSHGSWLG